MKLIKTKMGILVTSTWNRKQNKHETSTVQTDLIGIIFTVIHSWWLYLVHAVGLLTLKQQAQSLSLLSESTSHHLHLGPIFIWNNHWTSHHLQVSLADFTLLFNDDYQNKCGGKAKTILPSKIYNTMTFHQIYHIKPSWSEVLKRNADRGPHI